MKKIVIAVTSILIVLIAFVCLFRMSQKVNPNFNFDIIIDYLEEFPGFQRTINSVEDIKLKLQQIEDMPKPDFSGGIFSDIVAGVNYVIDIIIWWFETLFSIIKIIVNIIIDLVDIVIWSLTFPSYLLK